MMNDDPRLTRYALGEMNDDERTAFERELDDAGRAEADAIRALAGTLTTELKAEPLPASPMRITAARRSPRTRWLLAAAASVAVAGIVVAALSSRRESRSPLSGGAIALKEVGAATLLYSNESRAAYGRPAKETESLANRADAAKQLASVRGQLAAGRDKDGAARPYEPQLGVLTRSAEAKHRAALEADAKLSIAESARRVEVAGGQAPVVPPNFWKTNSFDGNDSFLLAVDEDGAPIAAKPKSDVPELREAPSADRYACVTENPFVEPRGDKALSTFGIDVDTASYANVRRFLTNGQLPPADAVRIEELINYFPTSDAPPTDGRPFATYAEVARCPWSPSHQLVRVALKAREIDMAKRPASNLVFLVDVSGSMNEPDKLPLVKRGLQKLVDNLGENDRVAIVVYAGNSGLALASTNAENKDAIRQAIDKLEAGGSTNGGQGIELAYATALSNFRANGTNRVILCTDGDFNVGVTDRGSLVELIQQKAKAGVFLSVLGFGRGNLKDDTMESLADKGNGNYAYIDGDREATKVLVEQASGTLVTVAKDVKIQVEFNPAAVRSYRLIGYENRALAKEDFNNDLKDAGEIGAGHNVVALYEIEPTNAGGGDFSRQPATDPLKYQPATTTNVPDANANELLTLKLRFKKPDAPLEQGTSELIERALAASDRSIDQASPDFQFAASVAGFGMMLRGSSSRGTCDWPTVARLARAGVGADAGGYRAEFVALVDRAAALAK